MISKTFLRNNISPKISPIEYITSEDDLKLSAVESLDNNVEYLLLMDNDSPRGIIPLKRLFLIEDWDDIDQQQILSKDFIIINKNSLNLSVFQDISTKYILVYSDGEYTGLINTNDATYHYDQLLDDTVKLFGEILDSSYNGILGLDENRNLIIVNKSAAEICGTTPEEAIDHHISQSIPDSPLSNFSFDANPSIGTKCIVNGKSIIANRSSLYLKNRQIGGISVFQDVTDDEKINNELNMIKENEEYLESIIENSYDGIYITDSKGMTLKMNKSYERITGIPREKLIGKYMKDLVKEGLLSTHLTDKVVESKHPLTLNQKAGNGKRLMITGSPIFDEKGEVSKVITNVRDITELRVLENELSISKEMAKLYKKEIFNGLPNKDIVYKSDQFTSLLHIAQKVAKKNSTVLILGETGVGKEVIAKFIHEQSERSSNNYVKINCGSIPENLLESELFGYIGGAFTGADPKGKIGMFELANNGTLFLDEVGELPMKLQSSLLRVLQDGEFTKVGGSTLKKVNVRIIAATNRNLEEMIDNNQFRSDLYYRLNVVSLYIPPLRDRIEDIPVLANHFVDKLNKKYKEEKILTPYFINNLQTMEWPGNIRELENFIEKQYVISESNVIDSITSSGDYNSNYNENSNSAVTVKGIIHMNVAIREVESQLVKRAMKRVHSTYKAANLLGMTQPTFYRKYKEYCKDSYAEEKEFE